MIERPDWGPGGENRVVARSGTSDAIASSAQIVREMEAWPNTSAPARSDVSQPSSAGFGPKVERKLRNSPDGYDARLVALRDDLGAMIEAEVADRDTFFRYCDRLSQGVRDKIFLAAIENPGLTILALRDKVKGRLTLDEAAEADSWWSKLKVVPR